MRFQQILHSRTGAVVIGATVLVGLGGASGAFAASMVTSSDIKNDTIRSRDVHNGTLGERDMNGYTVGKINQPGPRGEKGDKGEPGPPGPPGDAAKYDSPNWQIIDRNVEGSGDSYLRSGPNSADFGKVDVPSGVGSLGIRTGSSTDKADFGNEVDFAGMQLSSLNTVKYSIYTTNENNKLGATNLPNVTLEVDPNFDNNGSQVHYSSMVYDPGAQSAGWAEHDAGSDPSEQGGGWYFTNTATAQKTGCSQATLCTLTQAEQGIPDAKIYSVAISKGTDHAFSGAVDDLVINDTMYNFEPFGVTSSSTN